MTRAKSNRSKKSAHADGYESSESEGTKALNIHYEMEPQEFVTIGSENFNKLPAIDQARVYLLRNSPNKMSAAACKMGYSNHKELKTHLKQTFEKLEMDDPLALNK